MAPRKGNESASWEVDADKPKPVGETRVRRAFCTKELTLRPDKGVDTVHDIMLYAGRTWGDKPAFGWRDVLEVYNEPPESPVTSSNMSTYSGKTGSTSTTWSKSSAKYTEKLLLSPYRWMTHNQALQEVRDLGSGLRELGAGNRSSRGFFAIYSVSSVNWMMIAQACAFNAVPICTLYHTLTVENIGQSLAECGAKAIFTNADLLPTLERVIAKTPITLIVYDGEADQTTLDSFHWCKNLEIVHIDDLRQIGQDHPYQGQRAKRDDVYCCMYTSGGGGKSKGVLLTHGNICSAVGSIKVLMGEYLAKEEMYLAFLPQAHIMEFVVEMTWITIGLPIAYGRLKCLTDAGVKGCKNDIQEARPSIMIGVPQVWELLRKGIMAKVEEQGQLKKSVFNLAVKAKSRAIEKSIPGVAGVANALVFNQVRQSTGGRLRTLFNGGSMLARSTQTFLSGALVKMIQGYGLTEGTAMACVLHPSWVTYGSVGGPVPGAEIKLVDRPEEGLGYLSTNDPPQGEVYVRGPAVFKGYFNRPQLDIEAFTHDRWFKTGDIGQWNKDGTLSIIDRVRNHVRLSGGRYVALERLEAIYRPCLFVLNGCVLAYPNHTNPAMVAVVHPINIAAFARRHTIDFEEIEDLCNNPRMVELCLNELNALAKKEGLRDNELLEAIVLTTDDWTPESGFLTAAQKLRRNVIEQHYSARLDKVYKAPRLPSPSVLPDMFPAPPTDIRAH